MSGRFLIPRETLEEMARLLDDHDRDEMAIPSYLHKNPALRRMAWARLYAVLELLPGCCPEGAAVMDYGCGSGVLFERVLERASSIVGVDLVLDAARLWVERRELDRVTLLDPVEAEAQVAPGSLDLIVAAEVLEHVDDLAETLAFFERCLKPGGALLVSLPTENRAYRFGRKLAGFVGHYHHDNARSIDAKIVARRWKREGRRTIPAPGPLAIYWVSVYRRPALG